MKHPSGSASHLDRLDNAATWSPGGRSRPQTPCHGSSLPSVSPMLTLVLPPQHFPSVGGQPPCLFCFHLSHEASTAEVFQAAVIQGCEQPSRHGAGSCCPPCRTPATEKHMPQSWSSHPFPNLSLYPLLLSADIHDWLAINPHTTKFSPLKAFECFIDEYLMTTDFC